MRDDGSDGSVRGGGRAGARSEKHVGVPVQDVLIGMATIPRAVSEVPNVEEELRRTNEELLEAREFLENVLESSTEYSIIAKDLERRIMAWNRGAGRIYGYEAS